MGANESRQAGNDPGARVEDGPEDYYTILEVNEDATADEIKRSFRRLALKHHPDKNYENIEEATKRFATIQQAYEVLSDEQERAWYDSHRASLVPEPDAETIFDEIRRGASGKGTGPRPRDRGLTVRHLAPFFDASKWDGFDDSGTSFFALYRNLFTRLAEDERAFTSHSPSEYPSFGYSTWTWAGPGGSIGRVGAPEGARFFYNFWLGFATAKDFVWVEPWSTVDAPDRQVRRLMERDNKKARESARREYNDTIRSLVTFIRKRDPRYKSHQAVLTAAKAALPRGGSDKSMPALPKSKSTPAPVGTFSPQAWQEIDSLSGALDTSDAWATAEDGGEAYECVACRKTFRSEAAWASHERSKKHLREMEQLRLEMLADEEELGLGDEGEDEDGEDELMEADEEEADLEIGTDENRDKPDMRSEDERHSPPRPKVREANKDTSDHEVLPKRPPSTVGDKAPGKDTRKVNSPKNRQDTMVDTSIVYLAKNELSDYTPSFLDEDKALERGKESYTVEEAKPELSKKEKRRAREAAKMARQEAEASTATAEVCNVCKQSFTSRTKLFAHINETGHALASGATGNGTPRGATRGKKTKDKKW